MHPRVVNFLGDGMIQRRKNKLDEIDKAILTGYLIVGVMGIVAWIMSIMMPK